MSDVDEKIRPLNRSGQATFFDPENQKTRYNDIRVPDKIPIIEINEKPSETKEYHWLKTYTAVPSNSPFNAFLNKFKHPGSFPPTILTFQGVRYRYLRVGTNSKLNFVRMYRQFVIGSNFTIYRLGMNGSPNVDIGVSVRARERRLPMPINKKFTIASLFWANELLKSQNPW